MNLLIAQICYRETGWKNRFVKSISKRKGTDRWNMAGTNRIACTYPDKSFFHPAKLEFIV